MQMAARGFQPVLRSFPVRAPISRQSSPVAPRLSIDASVERTGFSFQPCGEYPRRVKSGEALAEDRGLALLSPLPGVVDFDSEGNRYLLRVEGQLAGSGAEGGGQDFESAENFLAALDAAGLVALDYHGLRLSDLFRSNQKAELVYALNDARQSVDWPQVWQRRRPQIEAWQIRLRSIFPEMRLVEAPAKSHRWWRNELRLYSQQLPEAALARRGAGAFLGPATVLALIEFLLEGRSFNSRLFGCFSSRAGAGSSLRLPNGYMLEDLQVLLRGGEMLKQSDPIRTSTAVSDALSIYQGDAVYPSSLFAGGQTRPAPCSGCGLCEALCPVQARPLALLDSGARPFRGEVCTECGICGYVCESGIPVTEYAIGVRKKAGHAESAFSR